MGQSGLVQHVQSAVQSVQPFVPAVVVGGGQQIESGGLGVIGQSVGGVKGGVARVVGAAGQGGLEIAHRIVSGRELPGSELEHVAIIVAVLLGHIGILGDGHVAHNVACYHQMGYGGFRSGRGRLRL